MGKGIVIVKKKGKKNMGNIFDILGPVMVGPSSSHTAGAVRIGMVARQLFGRQPEKAEVILHGSFAATGKGHGTDRALIAGLLGMMPDDMRIPDSYEVAKDMGMDFVMKTRTLRVHIRILLRLLWKQKVCRR